MTMTVGVATPLHALAERFQHREQLLAALVGRVPEAPNSRPGRS